MGFMLIGVLALAFSFNGNATSGLKLDGLPIQLEFADFDGDGEKDLFALMVKTKTEGTMDTWLEDGAMRGLYTDQTTREKYLVTYYRRGGEWVKHQTIQLGRESVLGMAIHEAGPDSALMLWQGTFLNRYKLKDGAWKITRSIGTPGTLAGNLAAISDFPFWYEDANEAWWLVPDLTGLHQLPLNESAKSVFWSYPADMISRNKRDGNYQTMRIKLPKLQNLDADGVPELLVSNDEEKLFLDLGTDYIAGTLEQEGSLVDLDGDGLLDLLETVSVSDMDKMKDLPKVTSTIRSFKGTAPMVFEEEPSEEQVVAGMLFNPGDSINFGSPFLDVNNDGLMDLTGMALKLSMWQAMKVVATGRMRITFLLNLNMQQQDGSFKALAGGPLKMTWPLNLRRLSLPSFAQIAADYDGDGWLDILQAKDNKYSILPLGEAGFLRDREKTYSYPKGFKDPDQFYGADLNGNGKAELIMIKLRQKETAIYVAEVSQ